jgi:hypothetical protein
MGSFDFYKVAAIVSPFLTAILTGFVTHLFSVKSKKEEVFLKNRIDECKVIVGKLVEFKMFCMGRVSSLTGNEYSSLVLVCNEDAAVWRLQRLF